MWPFFLFLAGCSQTQNPSEGTVQPAVVSTVAAPQSSSAIEPTLAPSVAPQPTFLVPPRPFKGPPLARTLPAVPALKPLQNPRVAQLQTQIARYQLFAAYRELITLNKNAGLYDEAARLARAQAAQYRVKGLKDAAIIADNEAGALESQLRVFLETRPGAVAAADRTTSASNEPVTGCYLGAFIDRDDSLGAPFWSEDRSQWHRAPEQLMNATGRHPGSLFTYLSYGQPFPRAWAYRLKARGTIPHIAWEPTTSSKFSANARSLPQIRDDAYLREFARQIREFDFPVFIRFASEMNGFWTRPQYGWNGDAKLYREKFRLVNRVLHEVAPRVATIWCVNNPPLGNAFDYYPGDDGCDWVGVNFYAVPYHEDKINKPAFDENPLALLDPVYKRFAARKPIAICEFAASHQARVDPKPIPNFAISKLRLVYGALPLLYPRVKLVDWFDMNTLRYMTKDKTPNNFLLTDHPQVLRAWQEVTNNRHFMQSFLHLGSTIPPVYRPFGNQKIASPTQIGVWAKNFGADGTVFLGIDGQGWTKARSGGATYLDLDPRAHKRGAHTLSALLYDSKKRFQKRVDLRFST
ncbi:hypothetical protein EON83_27505 [bacterium]|nr:MAG: hypothetical protein EON83_27505 [bacterium]